MTDRGTVSRPACAAPSTSLYLAPGGWVSVCCWTERALGRYGDGRTLRELWDSPARADMADAVAGHDFSRGCARCGDDEAAGNGAWSGARHYDHAPVVDGGRWPSHVHFALTNTCNLMCVMCHGDLSSAIRRRREHRPPMETPYDEGFVAELRPFLPHLRTAMFTGGEPFLCRPTRRVWEEMAAAGAGTKVEVTTNGTRWDARTEELVRALAMDIVVSIDGATAATNEAIRVGTDHARLRANVDAMQATAASYGGTVKINFCLMRDNWHELGALLADADGRGLPVRIQTVVQPPSASLFRMPEPELAAVVAALDAEDREVASRLGRNRAVWDAERARLRRHLDALRSGTPVDRPSRPATAEADRLAAEVERWAARPLLRVTILDEVVSAVAAPPWADGVLDAHAWVGRSGSEILAALAAALGPAAELEVRDHGRSLHEMAVAMGPASVRAVRLEDQDDAGRRVDHLAIGVRLAGDGPA